MEVCILVTISLPQHSRRRGHIPSFAWVQGTEQVSRQAEGTGAGHRPEPRSGDWQLKGEGQGLILGHMQCQRAAERGGWPGSEAPWVVVGLLLAMQYPCCNSNPAA